MAKDREREREQEKNIFIPKKSTQNEGLRVARRKRRKSAQRQPEMKNYTFELLFIIYTLIASDIQNVNEQFVNIYYVANAFDRLRPLPTPQSHIYIYIYKLL